MAVKLCLSLLQIFDSEDVVKEKSRQLADMIKSSKHVVAHTGAGISTAAGIPDFRGPKGELLRSAAFVEKNFE